MSVAGKVNRVDRKYNYWDVVVSGLLLFIALVCEVTKSSYAGYLMVFPLWYLCNIVEQQTTSAGKHEENAMPSVMMGVLSICTIGIDFSCMVAEGQIVRQLVLTFWITISALLVKYLVEFFRLTRGV